MTCHDAREHFSALIDDALDAGQRAALDAHLATCADCRRELQRFRDTVSLVRGAAPVRAPAGFVDRVLEAARPVPWPRRILRNLFLPWPIKLPMEAAALVLVAVGVALVYRGSPELQRSIVQEPVAPVANEVRGYNRSAAQTEEAKPSEAQAPAVKPPEAAPPKATAPPQNAPATSPEKQAARSLYGTKEDTPREQDALREHAQRKEATRAQELSAEQRLKDAQTSASAPSAPAPPAAGGPQSTATAPRQAAPSRDADLQKRMESQDRQAPVVGKLEAPSAPSTRQRSVSEGARSGAVQQTEQRADSAKAQRPASPPQATASLSFAPPDVSGQLAVSDREVTLRSLKELVTRVGAAEAYRLDTADGSIIEIAVRREMYAELSRGLARLGRWQPSKEPSALPATVRVVVRITG